MKKETAKKRLRASMKHTFIRLPHDPDRHACRLTNDAKEKLNELVDDVAEQVDLREFGVTKYENQLYGLEKQGQQLALCMSGFSFELLHKELHDVVKDRQRFEVVTTADPRYVRFW